MIVADIYGNNHEVSVGTEVFIPCRNRGGHGAWVEVTKVNKKTFEAIEQKGSYIPGTPWKVSAARSIFAIVERPEGKGWIKHWVND